MNVGELKAALDEYGDHVEVYIQVFTDSDQEATFGSVEVDYLGGDVNGVVIRG
jgi:hypothetical protein